MDTAVDIAQMPSTIGKKNGEIKCFKDRGIRALLHPGVRHHLCTSARAMSALRAAYHTGILIHMACGKAISQNVAL